MKHFLFNSGVFCMCRGFVENTICRHGEFLVTTRFFTIPHTYTMCLPIDGTASNFYYYVEMLDHANYRVWLPPYIQKNKQINSARRAEVVAQAVAHWTTEGPRFKSRWELGFFLFSFLSFNQWCVLNQVPHGGATLLVFNFPRKIPSHAI